ncbi:hypothetical protein [Fodinibius salsisoli]|uniref:Apea-like HEPN domain-containing protein n=1 Tax=Fodinibius salsisoli TaxID=2820877 RepID=A0ABT3PI83_9BACT|nr:hypothetical protein [Fodinibius salsisoli]MCW9705610.1 hypothetical protein [Fodinibius salsisoli]
MIEDIIKNLEYSPLEENIKEFTDRPKTQNTLSDKESGTLWIIREGIQPVDLYCYLYGRFGPPNGFQMILRSDDSDNLIHWHYTLKYKGSRMDIMCMTFRLEIMHHIQLQNPDTAKKRFITKLKDDFSNHHKKISKIRNQIEKWKLFVNPFYRIKSVIEHQLEKLDSLALEENDHPPHPHNPEQLEEWKEKTRETGKLYTEAISLGLNIRMLAPIYAESFINLLIFLLAKQNIKNDKRLYESIIRQQIDIRVKTLHQYCNGFYQPVDYNNVEICKEFHSLMNNRNDLLHGNIDPTKSFYDTVYFDGKIPLFTKFRDFSFYSWEASIKNVTPDLAIKDYQTVQNFLSYLLVCLEKDAAKIVKDFMNTKDPGWNVGDGRPGILFPSHMVDMVPEFKGEDVRK